MINRVLHREGIKSGTTGSACHRPCSPAEVGVGQDPKHQPGQARGQGQRWTLEALGGAGDRGQGSWISAEIRWLGRMVDVWACFGECQGTAAAAVAAVLGETTFGRLRRSGVRLQGRRHEVKPFEEERPDAFSSRCYCWGYIGPRYSAAAPRCSFCEGEHPTVDHRCSVQGCGAGTGHPCPRVVAKRRKLQGPPPR